jgi:hypothetical protein
VFQTRLIITFLAVSLLSPIFLSYDVRVHAQLETETGIEILPESIFKYAVGEVFTINVTATNCADVYGVQVDFHYDPTVLEAISVLEGPFLPSFGHTLVVINESRIIGSDPAEAQVYYVATLVGAHSGAFGDGVLFTVTFKVLSNGSSALHFISYSGGGSIEGTYFMTSELVEIIPILHDAFYGVPILLGASFSNIFVGQSTILAGHVIESFGILPVTIQYKKQWDAWTNLTMTYTDFFGFFSHVWNASEVGSFKFRASITTGEVCMESNTVTVNVEPVVPEFQSSWVIVPLYMMLTLLYVAATKEKKKPYV